MILLVIRRLRFLVPLAIIFGLPLLVYLVYSTVNLVSGGFSDNLLASQIRDQEEMRVAKAWTQISQWKRSEGHFPFNYNAIISSDSSQPFVHLGYKPSVIFSILMPNRRQHPIDEYTTSYATDALVHVLQAVEHDISRYGKRFASINVTLCPTTDDLSNFTELNDIRSLLTPDSVKPRKRSLDNVSLKCRTVLDIANCLEVSSKTSLGKEVLLVVIEDDMLMELHGINQLWQILLQLDVQKSINMGLVQLHGLSSTIYYSFFNSNGGIIELLFLASILTAFLFVFYLRRWYRPFDIYYCLLFITFTFILSIVSIYLIGRHQSWAGMHKLLRHQSLFLARQSSAPSTGAAFLTQTSVAHALGQFLTTYSCREIDYGDGLYKAELIAKYLQTHNLDIYRTFPNVFKHSGLYSMYAKNILNPRAVE